MRSMQWQLGILGTISAFAQSPILDDLFHVHTFVLFFTDYPSIRRCLSGDSELQPDGVSLTSQMHCTLLPCTVVWIQMQGIASNLYTAVLHRGIIRKLPKKFCNTGFYCHQFIREVFERSYQMTRRMYSTIYFSTKSPSTSTVFRQRET